MIWMECLVFIFDEVEGGFFFFKNPSFFYLPKRSIDILFSRFRDRASCLFTCLYRYH